MKGLGAAHAMLTLLTSLAGCHGDTPRGGTAVDAAVASQRSIDARKTEGVDDVPDARRAQTKADMMDTLRGTCDLLLRSDVTVTETVTFLGTVVDAGGSQVDVKPHDPVFAMAHVAGEERGDAPWGVVLELADPGSLPLARLREEFGNYEEGIPTHVGEPPQVRFKDRVRSPRACSISADIRPGHDGLADGDVVRVFMFRK